MSKSEIMENPDICVLDGDHKNLQCMDMKYNDFNILHLVFIEQVRLLERPMVYDQINILNAKFVKCEQHFNRPYHRLW